MTNTKLIGKWLNIRERKQRETDGSMHGIDRQMVDRWTGGLIGPDSLHQSSIKKYNAVQCKPPKFSISQKLIH